MFESYLAQVEWQYKNEVLYPKMARLAALEREAELQGGRKRVPARTIRVSIRRLLGIRPVHTTTPATTS